MATPWRLLLVLRCPSCTERDYAQSRELQKNFLFHRTRTRLPCQPHAASKSLLCDYTCGRPCPRVSLSLFLFRSLAVRSMWMNAIAQATTTCSLCTYSTDNRFVAWKKVAVRAMMTMLCAVYLLSTSSLCVLLWLVGELCLCRGLVCTNIYYECRMNERRDTLTRLATHLRDADKTFRRFTHECPM